jgi:CTP:molybdopterin cytidylyltransferase MocA
VTEPATRQSLRPPAGPTIAGLVLAAGAGRRMGRPKALVTLRGEPLVDRAVRTLAAGGCSPVLAVLGASVDEVLAAAALPGATVVVNDDWASGMGSSLRAGLAALAALDDGSDRGVSETGDAGGGPVDAVLVALVDQPTLTAAAVTRLLDAHRATRVGATVASYGGMQRNPVVLDRSVWAQVSAAAVGELGARAFLRANPGLVHTVACDDVATPDDVDTPGDLERMEQQLCS